MTSEFTEDMNIDHLKNLLKSFRYFYRYQHGKILSVKMDMNKLEQKVENLTEKLDKVSIDLEKCKYELDYHKNRKLSFMERLLGKIKIKQ